MATRSEIREIIPGIEDDAMGKLLDLIHKETDALRDEKKKLEDDLAAANTAKATAVTDKEKAETALNDYKAEQSKKEAQAKKAAATTDLLRQAGIAEKYISLVAKALDTGAWELGDDGKYKDENGHVEAIKKDYADFVVQQKSSGAAHENPPTGGGSVPLGEMSMEEYIAARKKK